MKSRTAPKAMRSAMFPTVPARIIPSEIVWTHGRGFFPLKKIAMIAGTAAMETTSHNVGASPNFPNTTPLFTVWPMAKKPSITVTSLPTGTWRKARCLLRRSRPEPPSAMAKKRTAWRMAVLYKNPKSQIPIKSQIPTPNEDEQSARAGWDLRLLRHLSGQRASRSNAASAHFRIFAEPNQGNHDQQGEMGIGVWGFYW